MGAPVGSDSYITDQLDLKISELSETIDRFCYLVDRTDFNNINPALTDQRVLHSQIAWAILSFCINAQGVYIVRMIRPDLSRQYAMKNKIISLTKQLLALLIVMISLQYLMH